MKGNAGPRIITGRDHPILQEYEMHHCACCVPSRRTLVRDVAAGMGFGYPEFYCPKTGIGYRYIGGRYGTGTYIPGYNHTFGRDGRKKVGV